MSSVDTKERIVAAAEILFARHGYAGTSLRAVTRFANANIAAVNYHFGSKESLLVAVLDRVVVPLNEERVQLLDAAESGSGSPEVEQILTAFLLPDLRAIERLKTRDPVLPRFVARMYSEGSELMSRVIGRQFAETRRRFQKALSLALPELTTDDIIWRLHCVVGIVVYLFAGVPVPGVQPILGDDVEENLIRLLEVTIPIMTAPPTKVMTLS